MSLLYKQVLAWPVTGCRWCLTFTMCVQAALTRSSPAVNRWGTRWWSCLAIRPNTRQTWQTVYTYYCIFPTKYGDCLLSVQTATFRRHFLCPEFSHTHLQKVHHVTVPFMVAYCKWLVIFKSNYICIQHIGTLNICCRASPGPQIHNWWIPLSPERF